MITEGKFGPQEAIWLAATPIITKIFFTSPSTITNIVGNTAWYMTLISATVALVAFSMIIKLLNRFPSRDLIEVYTLSMGRIAGFIFSALLGLYLFFIASINTSEFIEILKVYVFEETPSWYLSLILVISVAVLSLLGLESMARMAKIIALGGIIGFLTVLILCAENYEPSNIFPLFGKGLDKTVINGLLRTSSYGEIIVVAIFAKSLQGNKYVKKVGFTALVVAILVGVLSFLCFTFAFPYYTSLEIASPMYELATLIDYGRFVQRIEPIFLFVWIASFLLSATILFYSFVYIFCNTFRINDKRPIVIGGILVLFSTSLMYRDFSMIIFSAIQQVRTFGFIPVFVFPIIALAIAAIRKKGGKHIA